MLRHHVRSPECAECAPVSLATPLLSNLDILENIALIREVHDFLPHREAIAQAHERLEALGFSHIARKRSAQCSEEERFVAQVVRASMMHYDTIVVIRPFVMLKDSVDIRRIAEWLRTVRPDCRCVILDMESNRGKYEAGGASCRIIA